MASRDAERPSTSVLGRDGATKPSAWPLPDSRPTSSSEGRRTRDISPESLRRFLVEDPSLPPAPTAPNNPPRLLEIPSELAEDVDDDDDNFATSATSESHFFATILSPPPFQRSISSDTMPQTVTNSSSRTLTIHPVGRQQDKELQEPGEVEDILQLPKLDTIGDSECDCSPSISSGAFMTPTSPRSLVEELPSFYDSNDDDDNLSSNDGDYIPDRAHAGSSAQESFTGYSLPRHAVEHKSADGSSPAMTGLHTASFPTAAHESTIPGSCSNFLDGPIDTGLGLEDFVNELGLLVDGIGNRNH
ncbi:hypothetical protein ED733_003977 [Metarhizium rileyi]|uniref:Uncharacterized protein n=1 Tax=Metarhizium rileyi (strain RCEF 4871) TaxID=1649241 RepID=A0A5C6G9G8_METRR|nr:hypothetical protein ED733_003977 [Metarhizium rileyi]